MRAKRICELGYERQNSVRVGEESVEIEPEFAVMA
jgi:hypothetical protein